MPRVSKRRRKNLNQLSRRQLRRYMNDWDSSSSDEVVTHAVDVNARQEHASTNVDDVFDTCVLLDNPDCLATVKSNRVIDLEDQSNVNNSDLCPAEDGSDIVSSGSAHSDHPTSSAGSSLEECDATSSALQSVDCQALHLNKCSVDCEGGMQSSDCVHSSMCTQGFYDCASDSSMCDNSSDSTSFVDTGNLSLPDNTDNFENSDNSASGGHDSFVDSLIRWALCFNISLVALSALLKILRYVRPDLPKDARTLLKTPTSTQLKEMGVGRYWHNGLISGLKKVLKGCSVSQVNISVNIDGLPLSRSSTSSLWPILCSALGKVFVVGAYHGMEKPDNANVFLEEFVSEAVSAVNNGVEINGKVVSVVFSKLICDAPAKAFVLNVKSHNAYFGCTKCTTEGDYVERRVVYPDFNAELRTDEDFRRGKDEDYHKGESILLNIPNFGPVSSVVLDYLHLICLGVVRKMVLLWMKGPLSVRVPGAAIKSISQALLKFQGLMPKEFVRRPRSLEYVMQFKGTEFRQIVLYTGPLVFFNAIPLPYYKHFMQLHVALVIVCSKSLCSKPDTVDYAEALLRNFAEGFRYLYGEQYVSHNVHNLVHLASDVRKFGCLDQFSAFQFENFMQELKSLIRKSDNPLPQLARRYKEKEDFIVKCDLVSYPKFIMPHYDGILPLSCRNPQFKGVRFADYTIDLSEANNCCGSVNGKVMVVDNFATCCRTNKVVAVGKVFNIVENLYTSPLPSSSLGIFKASSLGNTEIWPLQEIRVKYTRLPTGGNSFALFPLLHHEA